MVTMSRTFLARIALPVLIGQLAACLPAQETSNAHEQASALSSIPDELQDRGFDKFVDLDLLRVALQDLDAELVTDIALQMADGERVLMRSHKAVSADELLGVAIRLGGQQKDSATLMRLAKAVKTLGRTNHQAQVENARKLVLQLRLSAQRDGKEGEGSAKSLTVAGPLLREVRRAGALGDTEWLHSLSLDVTEIPGLTSSERQRLKTQIKNYIDAIAGADTPASSTLARLAGFRRRNP